LSEGGFARRHAGQTGDPATTLSLSGALADAWSEISDHADDVPRRELIRARLFGDPGAVVETVKIGRFAVLEPVGAGAMSVVYAAYDRELDRKVAIKLLRAELSTPDRGARLRREAQALARLSHANVIAIHDVGEWEDRLFLAMEFVQGATLATWQRAQQRAWREVLDVYLQAGRGLAAAHAAGLVHRDFKPANALIGDDGRVRVVDFGLVGAEPSGAGAKGAGGWDPDRGQAPFRARDVSHTDGSALDVDLTATRAALGTPAYMAPEQFESARVDGRADQFSFCVALHEALYGRRPFEGDDPAALPRRIRRGSTSATALDARVPRRLHHILQRGLSAAPHDRYPSMAALLADIQRVANAPRRRRRLALLAVAAGIAAAAIAGGIRWTGQLVEQERAQTLCARAVAAAENIVESDPTHAAVLLRDAPCPDSDAGWAAAASGTLQLPVARAVLRGLPSHVRQVAFSPEGRYLAVSVQSDFTQIWRRGRDGAMPPGPALMLPGARFRFSARGDQILTLSKTRTLRVWDLSRPDAPLVSLDSDALVLFVEFLPEDAGVFWVTEDARLRVWRPDARGASEELALQHQLGQLRRAWPSADRRHIILHGTGGEVEVWHVTGPPLRAERRLRVSGRSCRASSTYMPPGDRYLYVGCESGELERWDLEGQGIPEIWRGHSAAVLFIEGARDGRVLTASRDGTARVWRPGSEPHSEIVARHRRAIDRAQFSPDGRRVLSMTIEQVQVSELAPTNDVTVLHSLQRQGSAALSPDGLHAAVGYANGVVQVWDLRRKNSYSLNGHERGIWSAELDPDGARLATASFDGAVRVWDLSGREPPLVFRHTAPEGSPPPHVYAARFDWRGQRIASGAKDGTAQIWRADGRGEPMVLPGHEVWAYAVAWSPDGQWLATGSQLGAVRLWNARSGDVVVLAPPATNIARRIHDLAFSPDGARLVAIGQDAVVRMWDLSATPAMVEFQGSRGEGHTVAFSPDGRIIAAGDGSAVLLLDGRDLTVVARLDGHEGAVFHVAFSPDGRRLITASEDGTARVWLADGRLEHTFYGHTAWVVTAAFDPAGGRVVTGADDGVVRVWRLDAPRKPIVLRSHGGQVRFVAFTPDGERVVTAAMDGTARVWTLPAQPDGASLRRQLHAVTSACLTPGWRIQHLGESEAAARRHAQACVRRMTAP
jgi:WD40 repeat protein/tRNA A-37 threonylcarbamoyl transferase component Bud32